MGVLMGGQPSGKQIFDGMSCKLCDKRVIDDPMHIILKCDALQLVRANSLDKLKEVMPQAMWLSFNVLMDEDKLSFIISAFNCDFTPEWQDIYIEVAKWIYITYKLRNELYDALATGSNGATE